MFVRKEGYHFLSKNHNEGCKVSSCSYLSMLIIATQMCLDVHSCASDSMLGDIQRF